NAGVDFVAPGQYSALHVASVEAVLLEEVDGFRAARSAFAVSDNFDVLIDLTQPFRQFAEGNEFRRGDAPDLEFVGFADVDELELVATVNFGFDLDRVDVALHL